MIRYVSVEFPWIVMDVSFEVYHESLLELEHRKKSQDMNFLEEVFDEQIRRMFIKKIDPQFFELLDRIAKKKKVKSRKILLLNAHGKSENGIWYFIDEQKQIPVQKWVDEQKHSAYKGIGLLVCNEEAISVIPCAKPVFVSDAIVGLGGDFDVHNLEFHWSLFLGKDDEVDPYTIDYYLAQYA